VSATIGTAIVKRLAMVAIQSIVAALYSHSSLDQDYFPFPHWDSRRKKCRNLPAGDFCISRSTFASTFTFAAKPHRRILGEQWILGCQFLFSPLFSIHPPQTCQFSRHLFKNSRYGASVGVTIQRSVPTWISSTHFR